MAGACPRTLFRLRLPQFGGIPGVNSKKFSGHPAET
jgi:hypothetical protein